VTGIARLLKPLDEFLRVETLSGLALLTAAAVAIVFANSAWHAEFHRFWDVPRLAVGLSLHFLVNEILMAVFFLVVGLEIRREIHDGALSTPAQAALPLVAACGGIVAPALIYLAVAGEPLIQGWAVPTATDIAFTIGVLALLGRRVAPALRVLLLAIAIADDIAAVLIIAFFYADGIVPGGLALAAAGAVAARLGYRAGINSWAACLLSGALIWLGLLLAGVHPALAGVAAGLLAPMQPRVPGAQPAGEQLETALHPWVAFGVMPLFALANAGVRFEGLDLSDAMSGGLAGGVALGLFVGKPLGICVASAVAVRAGLCALPASVTPGAVLVAGCFAGIGFTMSIFIASLAFAEPGLLAVAKFGVLSGSVCAAVAGLLLGRMLLRAPPG
jgi:NhaA family Na+:H+ antiporter